MGRRLVVPCGHCNKDVSIFQKDLKRSKSGHAFCNRSCSASYTNKTKKKKTTDGYKEKLTEMREGKDVLVPIGEYQGLHVPFLHMYPKCGHEIMVSPHSAMYGKLECPFCHPISNSAIQRAVKSRDGSREQQYNLWYKQLGLEYRNPVYKESKFRVEKKPKKYKPKNKRRKLPRKQSGKHTIYLIKICNAIKVGETMYTPQSRFPKFDIEVIAEWKVDNKAVARRIEGKALRIPEIQDKKYEPPELRRNGSKECFNLEVDTKMIADFIDRLVNV